MKKSYREAFSETKISDEKLRKLIMEVFEQKFSFLSKSRYLRWINERTTSQRIKTLTVDWMSEEELKEHPTVAGFYASSNLIKIAENGYFPKMTLEHEGNHFLNAGTNKFPRYIDEGITEFLTVKSLKHNEIKFSQSQVSYKQNVYLVKLLYDIFGDELIKCYLTGVSSDFETRLSNYFGGKLHTFYDLIESIHGVLHSDNSIKNPIKYKQDMDNLNKTIIPEYKKMLITLIENSIKQEMLDFKYYSNSKINLVMLLGKINDRISIINEMKIPGINLDEYKNIICVALSNSYLCRYFSDSEIKGIVDKNIKLNENKTIEYNLKSMQADFDSRANNKDNMYYAAEMRIKTHNYYKENGFDISEFLLDFYTLLNSGKLEKTPREKQQLLHSLLFTTVKADVNIDLINIIINKYGELFSNMANVRTENRKTVSDSIFYDITPYTNGPKKYIEKRDNEFYFISYDPNDRQFSRKGMGFWEYSYNPDFPKKVEYIERTKNASRTYAVMFDEEFEKALFNGKVLKPIELLDDAIAEEIKNNIDYSKYKIKYSNGNTGIEVNDLYMLPDVHSYGRYIFDFEYLFKDLLYLRFLKPSLVVETIHKIVDEALFRTFQLKVVPENIKNSLYIIAQKHIINGDNISKEEVEKILIDLCTKEKEYLDSVPVTSAYVIRNESDSKKFQNAIETRDKKNKRMQTIKYVGDDSRKFADESFQLFIVEEYDKHLSSEQFKFGVSDLKFTSRFEYCTPLAKKVNFELLITSLRQIYNNLPDDYKNGYTNHTNHINSIIDKLLGYVDKPSEQFSSNINDRKEALIEKLEDIVINNSEYDITELDTMVLGIIDAFDKSFDRVNSILKERRPSDPKQRQVYDEIIKVYYDKNLSDEEKMIRIDALARLLNQPKEDAELKIIDDLIEGNRRKYVNSKSK